MKKILLSLILFFLPTWADEEKVSYLPPYVPYSSVSPAVQKFLDISGSLDRVIDSVAASYDVLGRTKTQNHVTNGYSFAPRQARMNVRVASLSIPDRDERAISAEYRFENGVAQYWLNGEAVSEEDYFNSIQVNQSIYIPDYVASLTAGEIRSLLYGSEPVYISEIADAELASAGALVGEVGIEPSSVFIKNVADIFHLYSPPVYKHQKTACRAQAALLH